MTLLLAACIPSADRPAPPRSEQPATASEDASTRQCRSELAGEGVEFRALPDRRYEGGCSALGTVQLLDIGTGVTNLGAMTCPLARQFTRWSREAVQPAASRWLGSRVERIETMGTYSCRGLNGQSGARLSEHSFANAVDVAAFVLADGRRLAVEQGWRGEDESVRRFLRAVHESGCRSFNIGLGPDANAWHQDHMHFDMGRGPYCR